MHRRPFADRRSPTHATRRARRLAAGRTPLARLALLGLLALSACANFGDTGGDTVSGTTSDATDSAEGPSDLPGVTELLTSPRGPGVLRIVSYNIEKNSVFEAGSPQTPRFLRLMAAFNADIYALQEVWDGPDEVAAWFDQHAPLPGGATWTAVDGGSTMTVSKFPVKHHRSTTVPDSGRKVSLSWVEVPESLWDRPLYLVNMHLTCCGGELNRQREADSVVGWIRQARAGTVTPTLPADLPLVMLGDLNLVGGTGPLDTLRTGDIDDEAAWGPDAPPDGDGTALLDVRPRHNGDGERTWTWRWDGSGFNPGRIDCVLASDSVLEVVGAAALNTTSLSPTQLAALGLDVLDVGKSRVGGGWVLDHLPLVVDLRIKAAR